MVSQTTEFPDIETDDDPLAAFGLDFDTEVAVVQAKCDDIPAEDRIREATERLTESSNRVAEFLAKPATGEPLYLDLETIPDFSRMDAFDLEALPVLPPVDTQEQLLAADQFLSQTVPEIEAWLAKHNPPREWLEITLDLEKSGKARKGVMEKFDAHDRRIASILGAEEKRIKRMSTTPMMCRICSLAWAVGGDNPVSVYAGDDPLLERHLLEMAWKLLSRCKPLVGFGVGGFDTPVLIARSMILGVHPAKMIDRKKYGSLDVLDLCQELYGNGWGEALGLKATCRSLGIEPEMPDTDGSAVYKLFLAGDSEKITAYNRSDVRLVQRLHREKMAGYFCV